MRGKKLTFIRKITSFSQKQPILMRLTFSFSNYTITPPILHDNLFFMYVTRFFYTLLFTGCSFFLKAQSGPLPVDTLQVTIDSAESHFISKNFQLLAQRYNIDATKALEIQAKLYPNPNLSVSTTIYNSDVKKLFPAPLSDAGELAGSLSQTIVLAGKINKNVKLAQANTRLSEYQFFDLIRTLKYSLRTTFYSIYYLMQSANVYKLEIENLGFVVNAYNNPELKPYISEREIVRVKAQLFSLENEHQQLVDQINDAQSQLRLLVQEKAGTFIYPVLNNDTLENADPMKYTLDVLIDSAFKGRTDFLIAQANTQISKLNYNYQKALAVPDLTAGVSYDQQGSYIHNYSALGLAMDLPFFNRNQGNIKSARATIKMNEATEESVRLTVEENVYRALQKAIDADKLFKKMDATLGKDYARLIAAALEQYKRRNMGLLEFLDFYDAYIQNALQINAVRYNKLDALENINFYTGSNLFNNPQK